MPTYKNRPPMEPGAELRRYTSLRALEQMLRGRQLRLTRIDQFRDPFEGSVPKQQIDDQVPIFSGYYHTQSMYTQLAAHPEMELPRRQYRDPWDMMTRRRKALTVSVHASCWTAGAESEAMWRLYCNDDGQGQGVALRSMLEKVERSVQPLDLVVSPITYRLYHEGPAFNDPLDPLLHKRLGFRCESEVRLLKVDEPHYNALNSVLSWDSTFGAPPAEPVELPTHIYLPWDARSVVDAITISPYASAEYEQRVRAAVASIAPDAAVLIELSVLSPHRYGANF
jgi:hypothetical protein